MSLVTALALAAAAATDEVALLPRPQLGYQFGREVFGILFEVPNVSGESRLEYPADVFLIGTALQLRWSRLMVGLTLQTNVGHPARLMTDRDWLTVDGVKEMWGNTHSRTELREWLLDGGVGLRVLGQDASVLYALAGLRVESNDYRVLGATGWLRRPDGSIDAGSLQGDFLISYQSRYVSPYVGARFESRIYGPLAIALEARLLHGFSSHDDDHRMRGKRLHADVRAFAWLGAIEAAVDVAQKPGELRFGLRSEIVSSSGVGVLHQQFYADDPGAKGDQTGLAFDDTFTISYLRVRTTAFAETSF